MTRRNLLLIVLLISVGANLFFVGGISYRMLSINQATDGRPLPPNLGWLVRDLSEERRSELEEVLRAGAREVRPLREEILSAQRSVNGLMSAEPFDANALQNAFAELRVASERYQAATQSQTVAILEQLTDEERLAAQQFVRQRSPRDGRPGPGPGGRPPPSGFDRPPPSDRPPQEPPQ